MAENVFLTLQTDETTLYDNFFPPIVWSDTKSTILFSSLYPQNAIKSSNNTVFKHEIQQNAKNTENSSTDWEAQEGGGSEVGGVPVTKRGGQVWWAEK